MRLKYDPICLKLATPYVRSQAQTCDRGIRGKAILSSVGTQNVGYLGLGLEKVTWSNIQGLRNVH